MYLSNEVYKEIFYLFLVLETSSEIKYNLWWLPHQIYLSPYIKVTNDLIVWV